VSIYAYNIYNEKKNLVRDENRKYPKHSFFKPENIPKKWILVTGDRVCFAKARIEKAPCLFYDSVKNRILYYDTSGKVIDKSRIKEDLIQIMSKWVKLPPNVSTQPYIKNTDMNDTISFHTAVSNFGEPQDSKLNDNATSNKPDVKNTDMNDSTSFHTAVSNFGKPQDVKNTDMNDSTSFHTAVSNFEKPQDPDLNDNASSRFIQGGGSLLENDIQRIMSSDNNLEYVNDIKLCSDRFNKVLQAINIELEIFHKRLLEYRRINNLF
jgi:hypothetical protein